MTSWFASLFGAAFIPSLLFEQAIYVVNAILALLAPRLSAFEISREPETDICGKQRGLVLFWYAYRLGEVC